MLKFILKIIPALFLWGIFIFVVLKIPYPQSLTQANLTQLGLFFIPLYFALTSTLNIFLKNIFISSSISLGLILLLILKALDSINIVTAILIIIMVALLVSYFSKKNKRQNLNPIKSNLTKLPKIPKLHATRKQN